MERTYICRVCGGSEYFEELGFYYCSDCHTQSQEVREEVHDFSIGNTTLNVKKSVQQKTNPNKGIEDNLNEFTSWELYNFILRGMVDELISLGATEEIKRIVLQLWANYLKALEVAFVTKTNDMYLPKLGIACRKRDAELIYGYGTEVEPRKKKKKMKLDDTGHDSSSAFSYASSARSSKQEFNKSKRALMKAEYESSYNMSSLDTLSLLDESLRSCKSLTSSVTYDKIKRSHLSVSAKKVVGSGRSSTRSLFSTDRGLNPNILNRKTLLALLYLGLLLLQEKIQLSDLLRWVKEGALSFYEVKHFFPSWQKLKGSDVLIFDTSSLKLDYFSLSKLTKELALFLNVVSLPAPDLVSIAKRYIEELQLPYDTVNCVEKLMSHSPQPARYFISNNMKSIPNYEGQAMAFVIVTLKLLLGLDGKTEYVLSNVARKLNSVFAKPSGSTELFVWNDWMKYIECRKTLLALYHFPNQDTLSQLEIVRPPAFIDFWNNEKTKDSIMEERFTQRPCVKNISTQVSSMRRTIKKLEGDAFDTIKPKFVASLTPQKSGLKVIFDAEPEILQVSAMGHYGVRNILKENFSSTTLHYLINPEQYVNLAQKKGLKITVLKKSAQDNVKKSEKRKKERKNIDKRRMKTFQIIDTDREERKKNQFQRSNNITLTHTQKKHKDNFAKCDSRSRPNFNPPHLFSDLPLAAEKILLRQLKKHNVEMEKNSKKCHPFKKIRTDLEDSEVRLSEISSPFSVTVSDIKKESSDDNRDNCYLYIPCSEYWFNEVNIKSIYSDKFKEELIHTFPHSFQWLLKECSSVIQMTVKELYTEILNIEMMHICK